MRLIAIVPVIYLVGLARAQEKWVWDGGNRHSVAKALVAPGREGPTARYQVYEDGADTVPLGGGRPLLEPLRPGEVPLGVRPGGLPLGVRPGGLPQGVRPGDIPLGPRPGDIPLGVRPGDIPLRRPDELDLGRPLPAGNRPLPPGGRPFGRPPIPGGPIANDGKGFLTGPIPSWEHPLPGEDPTQFDTCKCVHSFNCKSPGLKFGSCDAGKQYCCYNSPKYGLSQGGRRGGYGSKFDGNQKGPVLVGPASPDNLRPDFIDPRANQRPFDQLPNRQDFKA